MTPTLKTWMLTFTLVSPAGTAAFAADGGTPSHTQRVSKPKTPDIALPKFGELPKADGLSKPKQDNLMLEPSVPAATAEFSVVRVIHASAFRATPGGAVPAKGRLAAISLSGNPPTTEKFSTLIRVRSPQRASAPIQIEILDPRGEPALSTAGEVSFHRVKGDETDYLVDWDPTPCRAGGDYKLTIHIAGREMGTWPLKFIPEGK